MKKICFVTTISITLKTFVIDLAKYLHENGDYDITFICDYDEAFEAILPNYIKYIPVSMKRGISISGIGAILKLISIFKKEKFDMVQYSTPNASFYASMAGKLVGVPVRLYCQWGIVYVGFSGFKRKVFKAIEKMVCLFSTWIEPDSFGNLFFSRSEGLYMDQKSSVVWNGSASGVNLQKFDIQHKVSWRKEIRSKYDIAEDTFAIGFVGRITRDKGVNELLAVCRCLFEEQPDLVVMLIGDTEKTETINEEIYNWSINERRVIYCGRTTEVEKYLSAMDVFVLPSYREGFGSVVIEAEAMGIPVIVTDIPGPTDAMIPNETGLVVKKGDTESLLSAINIVVSDRKRLSVMSGNAVNFIRDRFNKDVLFEKIKNDRDRLLKATSKVGE